MATSGSRFKLDEDHDAGFKQAVTNNQTSLAFQYLLLKLEEMEKEIAELKKEKETSKEDSTPVKKTAKKATKKTTSSKSNDKDDENEKDDKDE